MQLERKFFTQNDLPVCEDCYKVSLDGGDGGDGGGDDDDDAVVDDLSPVDSIGQFWPLSPGLSGKGEYLASGCNGWQLVPWLDDADIFVATAIF